MASRYNFDEAYSTDSFTDSDWENICEHTGVDIGSEEENTSDQNCQNAEETSNKETEEKSENTGETGDKPEENVGEKNHPEEEGKKLEKSENSIGELRNEMKSLRKNLKQGRVQLLNFNEDDTEEIQQTYKEFKNVSKRIKRKFKELLYGRNENSNKGASEGKNIPVDAETEEKSPWKPIRSTFQGVPRFRCPSCDFIGRSMGRTYSHMADEHDGETFLCPKCQFTSKNPTSLHNHRKLYCPQKEK